VSELLQKGYNVRAGSRSKNKMENRSWAEDSNVELVSVDVLDKITLRKACNNIDVVYYLVHSMDAHSEDFGETDRIAAQNMKIIAEQEKINLIVYLGGLGDEFPSLSKHLSSRHEVGLILQSGKVPTTVLKAAAIIGSSSASFELLRYLVERLPVMITPKWVYTKNQPIAIRNVLNYLIDVLEVEETFGKTYDIGGPDILTYHDLMRVYAKEAGLFKRLILPVPVLTPKLSSYWVDLITPINKEIARPLVEGLRNEVIVKNNKIQDLIPQELIPIDEAIRRSLNERSHIILHNRFKTSGFITPVEFSVRGDPGWGGGSVILDRRAILVQGKLEDVWQTVETIGGKRGWYHANFLWKLRGLFDQLIGGYGMSRGRKDEKSLDLHDIVDFWKVSGVHKNRELLLTAEMKLPGYAGLKFEMKKLKKNTGDELNSNNEEYVLIEQIASFIPRGLGGLLYWYFVLPFHSYVFNGMLKGIAKNSGSTIIKGPITIKKHSKYLQ
jgi:uncharacterized protein YbjT (DUF2867 family)